MALLLMSSLLALRPMEWDNFNGWAVWAAALGSAVLCSGDVDLNTLAARSLWFVLFHRPNSSYSAAVWCLVCAFQPFQIIFLPVVICFIRPRSPEPVEPSTHLKVFFELASTYSLVFAAVGVCWLALVYLPASLGGAPLAYLESALQIIGRPYLYQTDAATGLIGPDYGVLWYLRVQMLPEHVTYFSTLLAMQPVLAGTVLTAIVAPLDTELAARLLYLLSQFYQQHPDMPGLVLGVWAVLAHDAVVLRRVRHLPWIALGLFVPLCVSPLMRLLWLQWGTGNANFLFFQGFCMWIALALLILEYVTAFLQIKEAVG